MTSHSSAKEFARMIFANWMASIPEACLICKRRDGRATPKGYFWGVIYPGPEIIEQVGGPVMMALPLHLYDRLLDAGIQESDTPIHDDDAPVYSGFIFKMTRLLERAHEMLR